MLGFLDKFFCWSLGDLDLGAEGARSQKVPQNAANRGHRGRRGLPSACRLLAGKFR